VLGAGRDLVVPPAEAQRLAAAAGDLGTLLWYPRGGHGLYEIVSTWTADVATWLGAILAEPDGVAIPKSESTGVDSHSRSAVEASIVLEPAIVQPEAHGSYQSPSVEEDLPTVS